MDADGDGAITEAEAERMPGGRPAPEGGTGGGSRGGADPAWIFRRLDRDDDGDFDGKDLEALLLIGDTDEDGKLSEDELMAILTENAGHLRTGAAPKAGEPAPAFALTAPDGETRISLAGLLEDGKPVVLVFGSFT
jgi:hypothetical protein